MKKSILSLLLVLTMVVSTFAALPMTASAEDYPGGLYFYEPWNTTPATQPANSAIASHDIEDYIDDTENHFQKIVTKETLTGGNNTILTITDKKYSTVQIDFPESLNGRTSNAFTTEGPNADLIVEFDLNVDPGNLAAAERPISILVGDKDFVYQTSSKNYTMGEGSANARRASAAYLSTKVTENGNLTCYTNAKDSTTATEIGSVSANEWHRYKMVFHLTDSTNALTTWSLYVDGTAIQENVGICKAPSIDCIKLIAMGTTDDGYSCNIDNLSVYKKNSENQMFSTESLAIAINRVFANKSNYETEGEGSQQLDDLNTAYDAAVTALSTSYTTAQADEVTAQANVDAALASLTVAENALKEYLSGITYPGGVLMYESFTGIAATGSNTTPTTTSQPKGTNATIYKKKGGNDSGAGLGNYARQSDYSISSVIAEFDDASYFGEYVDDTTTIDEVAAQGPNAKLTLEFDHRMESLDVDKQTADLRIMLGTNEMSSTMNSNGRAKSAASVFLVYPNIVNVYKSGSSANTYYLPDDMTIEQWHRYQLTLNLTNEDSEGMSTFTFTVDGKNLVDENGNSQQNYVTILDSGAITKAQLVSYYADVNGVDNVSVYKSNVDNEALSTAELMTKLHEVNANMALYRAAAEGIAASQLAAFETAVAAAGTMVTTAFGTYDANGAVVNAAKTQADIDEVLASLISAEAALKAVLPYYVISEHNIDENDYITAVTVEEIKAYTDSPVKLIVATYDTNGLSKVTMMDFDGAHEYELTTKLSVTNKEAAVFVWEMNDLEPLANTYYFGEAVVQD